MDRESIVQLIKEINGPNATVEHSHGWVNTNCPLAPWLHDSGHDSSPSFGIKVEDDGQSRAYCFTCKTAGSVVSLLKSIAEYTEDRSLIDYYEPLLSNEEFIGPPIPEWNSVRPRRREVKQKLVPLGAEYEDLYDPLTFSHRGITRKTARKIGLLHGDDRQGIERVIFPVRGLNGELYGYTGRAIKRNVRPKIRDFYGLKKEYLLLGLHTLPKDPEHLVLVEGLYAYAKVLQAGHPAVAAMHANLTEHQAKWLIQIKRPVVIFFDKDLAGRVGAKVAARRLVDHVPVRRVVYPKSMPDKTDPDDLTEEQIAKMIDRARLVTCVPKS